MCLGGFQWLSPMSLVTPFPFISVEHEGEYTAMFPTNPDMPVFSFLA